MKEPETTQEAFDNFHKAWDNMVKVMKEEKFGSKLLYLGTILFILNLSITSFIYSFKNPSKTQMEVFKHIPESFEWNFKPTN